MGAGCTVQKALLVDCMKDVRQLILPEGCTKDVESLMKVLPEDCMRDVGRMMKVLV